VSGTLPTLRVPSLDNVQQAARTLREATRRDVHWTYPLGGEAAAFLRWKRDDLTEASYNSYENILDKWVLDFCDLELRDFEPPIGIERLEEFLDRRCGHLAAGTYNSYHAYLSGFFKWAALKGKLHGNPMPHIKRRKKRDVHRTIFDESVRSAIFASGPDPDWLYRDRVALCLLLKFGLRKGALANIQFKHFDRSRKRLTVFTKGEVIRDLPLRDQGLWEDLGKHRVLIDAKEDHYLMCSRKMIPHGKRMDWAVYPTKPLSGHGLHNWWYGCLQRAGVVDPGVTRGERPHKARHTALQVFYDKTKDPKLTQTLAMHKDIRTTMNTYVVGDVENLGDELEEIEL